MARSHTEKLLGSRRHPFLRRSWPPKDGGSVPSHNNALRGGQGCQASSGTFRPNDGNPGRGGSVYLTTGFGHWCVRKAGHRSETLACKGGAVLEAKGLTKRYASIPAVGTCPSSF